MPAVIDNIKQLPVHLHIKDIVEELSEEVDLNEADVIVAGGRGMGSQENFRMIHELAELLNGAVGASRPAVEEGWISHRNQVGQSGKIVSPKLYIACGISGATQHISGIMDSDFIVAINKDANAPIFNVADIGIVGDVGDVLPVMIAELRARKV